MEALQTQVLQKDEEVEKLKQVILKQEEILANLKNESRLPLDLLKTFCFFSLTLRL